MVNGPENSTSSQGGACRVAETRGQGVGRKRPTWDTDFGISSIALYLVPSLPSLLQNPLPNISDSLKVLAMYLMACSCMLHLQCLDFVVKDCFLKSNLFISSCIDALQLGQVIGVRRFWSCEKGKLIGQLSKPLVVQPAKHQENWSVIATNDKGLQEPVTYLSLKVANSCSIMLSESIALVFLSTEDLNCQHIEVKRHVTKERWGHNTHSPLHS